jgi:hypothetical protein
MSIQLNHMNKALTAEYRVRERTKTLPACAQLGTAKISTVCPLESWSWLKWLHIHIPRYNRKCHIRMKCFTCWFYPRSCPCDLSEVLSWRFIGCETQNVPVDWSCVFLAGSECGRTAKRLITCRFCRDPSVVLSTFDFVPAVTRVNLKKAWLIATISKWSPIRKMFF